MNRTRKFHVFTGLSLSLAAFSAFAQDEPTIVVLPDEAAETARDVTENIVLPDEAVDGLEVAEANRAAASDNAAEAAESALVALAEAQENAADAAQSGLETAVDAVEGARGDLGRGDVPADLPDQVPTEIPAGPGDAVPDSVDLPTPSNAD